VREDVEPRDENQRDRCGTEYSGAALAGKNEQNCAGQNQELGAGNAVEQGGARLVAQHRRVLRPEYNSDDQREQNCAEQKKLFPDFLHVSQSKRRQHRRCEGDDDGEFDRVGDEAQLRQHFSQRGINGRAVAEREDIRDGCRCAEQPHAAFAHAGHRQQREPERANAEIV